MGYANLNGVQFRIDPEAIAYNYSIDYSIIETLGGRVIQVLGATVGDITITGLFGQQRPNANGRGPAHESWELAESFGTQIRALMDQQVVPPKHGQSGSVHQPLRFTFLDGVHNWDMKVLIKAYEEVDGNGSIEHRAGKYSYGYRLTLFLVEDSSLTLSRVQSDAFIARIAKGIGWKETHLNKNLSFTGSDLLSTAEQFIVDHSTDGTYDGYVLAALTNQLPPTSQPSNTSGDGGGSTTRRPVSN